MTDDKVSELQEKEGFETRPTDPIVIECQSGEHLSALKSKYITYYKDRMFKSNCTKGLVMEEETACQWQGPINDLQGDFNYTCYYGYEVVTGIKSNFTGKSWTWGYYDRQYEVKCCEVQLM